MTQREKYKRLFQAIAQFWNPAYSCFTFGKVNLVPTIEEYMALLRCSNIQVDKVYSKDVNVPTFLKRLMNITGMTHPDAMKKVDVFALSIYGLVVFPRHWDMLTRQSLTYLISLIREFHQSRQF
ncbi:hypothetical protein Gotri_026732 [Gossypium trilobum]|uniref:DUF7745 domain-containing protein n=1 Tax=Gossypium trilobum TaxID=34281 RepID=A0A7J9FP42_9ROSI|nr:hypothetical protein [Gossypium trilobum]